MNESKGEDSKNKWSRNQIIGIAVIVLLLAFFFVYLPIRSHIENNNCKSLASAPITNTQDYNDLRSLYYQQQPPPQLPFNYYSTVYNNCVASESIF